VKKTLQRWSRPDNHHDGRIDAKRIPRNKLSELEIQRIIVIANQEEYASLSPCKIVPKLADEGIYIASEASFYRLLKSHNQLTHRGKSKPRAAVHKPKALTATGPNQIYTWDITYLQTQVRGMYYFLYLVMDIFSRKVVGWQVHDQELSVLAADLIKDICEREKILEGEVTLHSDNGSPMKGATMLATLHQLGVAPSFSRPSVSNDNPYSESLFRTLKYRQNFPERPFSGLIDARKWVDQFVDWYNNDHLHSGIKCVTPAQRHDGKDVDILAQRKEVYLKAKSRHPNRWSGEIRCWDWIDEVFLNPEKCKSVTEEYKAA
jgi:putative transposase